MNEKKRLVKNTMLIAIGNFGSKLISFLLLPLYTSILSTSEYGVYDFIVAVSAFLLPIFTFSMHEALFRFIIDTNKDDNDFKKIISNALIFVIFGIIILLSISLILHFIVPLDNKFLFIYIFFYVAASSLYAFSNNFLRGLGKIKEYAILSSIKNVLQLVLNVVVVAVFRWGMEGLLLSICVAETLAFLTVVAISKMWRYVDIKLVSKKELKPMLKYSLPLIPNALSSQVINLSDRLIITGFMNTSANGVYSVSYKFPNIIETVYHYFYTAWSESASRVLAKGKEKALEYYQSLHDTVSNFIFSFVIMMIAGMPILFRLFIRGNYVEGFKYIPILLLAMYFDCMGKFYSGIFTALKKTKVMATTTTIAAIINILINILLIKKFGLYAAALSTLIAEVVMFVLRKNKLKQELNFNVSTRNTTIMIIISIIILSLYNYNNFIMLGISISLAGIYSIIINRILIETMLNKIKPKLLKIKK